MLPWNDKHRTSFVLAFINLGDCVLILGNNRALSCTGQIVAETTGRV
jgi:hypothetical protein